MEDCNGTIDNPTMPWRPNRVYSCDHVTREEIQEHLHIVEGHEDEQCNTMIDQWGYLCSPIMSLDAAGARTITNPRTVLRDGETIHRAARSLGPSHSRPCGWARKAGSDPEGRGAEVIAKCKNPCSINWLMSPGDPPPGIMTRRGRMLRINGDPCINNGANTCVKQIWMGIQNLCECPNGYVEHVDRDNLDSNGNPLRKRCVKECNTNEFVQRGCPANYGCREGHRNRQNTAECIGSEFCYDNSLLLDTDEGWVGQIEGQGASCKCKPGTFLNYINRTASEQALEMAPNPRGKIIKNNDKYWAAADDMPFICLEENQSTLHNWNNNDHINYTGEHCEVGLLYDIDDECICPYNVIDENDNLQVTVANYDLKHWKKRCVRRI